MRQGLVRRVGEGRAGSFGELRARQAVAGVAVAQAIGAVGEVEQNLILGLRGGGAARVQRGLTVGRHDQVATGGGVVDPVNSVVEGFVVGVGARRVDIGAERVTDVAGVGRENLQFAHHGRGGGGFGELQADLGGGGGCGEGDDAVGAGVAGHGAAGKLDPGGAVPGFERKISEGSDAGRSGIQMRAAHFHIGGHLDVQGVQPRSRGLPGGAGVGATVHGVERIGAGGEGAGDGRPLVGQIHRQIGAGGVAGGSIRWIKREFPQADRGVERDEAERRRGDGVGEDEVALDVGVSGHVGPGDGYPTASA